jgi:DNA-directed RNA polymerase subunit beta
MATQLSNLTSSTAITSSFTGRKRVRKSFGRIREPVSMPNLIEVQRESYEQFLRSSANHVSGLEKTLRSVFPIGDFAGSASMEFVRYEL